MSKENRAYVVDAFEEAIKNGFAPFNVFYEPYGDELPNVATKAFYKGVLIGYEYKGYLMTFGSYNGTVFAEEIPEPESTEKDVS